MEINWLVILAATIVPLVIGFIWYNPKVFGNAWMSVTGVTPESAKKTNMGVVFGLTALFSFLIAFIMSGMVIHQYSVFGLLTQQPDFATEGSASSTMLKSFMDQYGTSYRTFKHGAFHGTIAGLFFALPVLGVNCLFEGKGFKYIAINGGYWIVSLALMGGILCAWM